jgi:hypothetical protein
MTDKKVTVVPRAHLVLILTREQLQQLDNNWTVNGSITWCTKHELPFAFCKCMPNPKTYRLEGDYPVLEIV